VTKRRVVVTGLGIVSPVGNAVQQAWQAIQAGQSGVRLITEERPEYTAQYLDELSVRIAGLVPNAADLAKSAFKGTPAERSKMARRLARFVIYGVEAARQAFEDSGLEVNEQLACRAGCALGSGIGGLGWIQQNHQKMQDGGPRKVSPFFIPGAIINMVAGIVSIEHELQGPNISIVTACTSGTHNIGHGARMIAYGDAEVMVCGGAEMATEMLTIAGFSSLHALSSRNQEPTRASRPWDKDRDGFVLGEGAGVLVLEEYEHAKKRGATIYAELVGFGMSADAYHMTAPEPSGRGFVATMRNTLQDAGVNAEQVDYINAHATSTPMADPIEANAVKQLFQDHAYRLAISSTKSMTGHLLGAAGAIEAIFSILALRDQVAPPTINLDHPDEGCDLNFVAHTAQQRKMRYALSNSFGFGGTNGSLLFKKI